LENGEQNERANFGENGENFWDQNIGQNNEPEIGVIENAAENAPEIDELENGKGEFYGLMS